MFPIGDDNTARKTLPVVTYGLLALNILFFFAELSKGDAFIEKWAFVPSRFLSNPFGDSLTLFTAMLCMRGGFIWEATCFTYGSSVTMWKTVSDTSSLQSSTCSVGLRRLLHSWRSASDQTCRIWERRVRLRECLELTFCCSHRERSKYCSAGK